MSIKPCASDINPTQSPVGILMLDTRFPRIPGDVGNPATFPFPVLYRTVRGATPENVVLKPDANLVELFIRAGKELIQEGAAALTTSCGFMALFHQELVAALDVPVFTSSLLQIHLARAIMKPGQSVGIITARKQSLTPAHLAGVGVDGGSFSILGMEGAHEFSQVFIHGKQSLDEDACRREMQAVALKLKTETPSLGAVVLECTNMGPYSRAVRHITGVPVFDVVTLIRHAHACVNP